MGATSHSQCPTVNALPAGYKDDVVSASEDSSLSTEECNVAKAARIEGPSEGFWGGHTVTAIPAVPEAPTKPWTARDADAFYNVSRWSEGYFRVSEEGLLCATPSGGGFLR